MFMKFFFSLLCRGKKNYEMEKKTAILIPVLVLRKTKKIHASLPVEGDSTLRISAMLNLFSFGIDSPKQIVKIIVLPFFLSFFSFIESFFLFLMLFVIVVLFFFLSFFFHILSFFLIFLSLLIGFTYFSSILTNQKKTLFEPLLEFQSTAIVRKTEQDK